jgi:malate dehydrogenase (oxaloacetate-decarboxylating)(NADP+)
VRATTINEEMKLAAVRAIADLAKAESSEVVAQAYQGEELVFGADYLIPKPFDLRLIVEVAAAVAKAAMDTGVAKQPIEDFERYRERLGRFVFRSGMLMKPVFERARRDRRRLVFAEGEDERILRALQVVVDDGIARPILVGRPDVVVSRIEKLGLRLEEGRDFSLTNPESDPRYDDYWRGYHRIMERRGVSPDLARTIMRTNSTVIAAMMMQRGEADAMICGTYGHYGWHLKHVLDVVGMAPGIRDVSAISALIVNKGTFFICDTQVTPDPSMEEIVEMTMLGADVVRRFGMNPKVALISHSNFGNADTPSARKMRAAVVKLRDRVPDMEVEGEMHADSAVNPVLRQRVFPNARLSGAANLLVYPNLEAANGAFNLLKAAGDGLAVGPLLVGAAKPVHIVTPSISARGLVNMSALAVVDSQSREGQKPLL